MTTSVEHISKSFEGTVADVITSETIARMVFGRADCKGGREG